jgi:hypothetical protein
VLKSCFIIFSTQVYREFYLRIIFCHSASNKEIGLRILIDLRENYSSLAIQCQDFVAV